MRGFRVLASHETGQVWPSASMARLALGLSADLHGKPMPRGPIVRFLELCEVSVEPYAVSFATETRDNAHGLEREPSCVQHRHVLELPPPRDHESRHNWQGGHRSTTTSGHIHHAMAYGGLALKRLTQQTCGLSCQ